MKVAISARMLKAFPDDGISRFTNEVVKRIIKNNPGHRFALIFDREQEGVTIFSPNTEQYLLKPAARHPLQWYIWHEWQLPGLLKKTGADIFLSPDGILSLRSGVPSIAVIHDLNFYHRPYDIPKHISLYYRYFFRKFAQKAVRIITVSDFCKRDISSCLKIDPGLIDIAYNGVSEYFTPAEIHVTDKFRKELTGGNPYFLFVGRFSPRKNIAGVINGYNRFRGSTDLRHKLVLTGRKLFLNRKTDSIIRSSPWSGDIILTGPRHDEELRLLYASATALVFVSWFEGFGIPAAEAMRCGTPVILSNTTSLPEVGGEAALYSDPGDIEEICLAMVKIATDGDLRQSLAMKGETESKKFTWDKTAEIVWQSIEKAAGIRK